MLQSQLSPRKVTVQTYVGVASGPGQTKVPVDINGLTIVQYTPFEGKDNDCNQMAAVKIWAELNPNPVCEGDLHYFLQNLLCLRVAS